MSDVFGVDIDSTWSFADGDLQLVRGESNLAQAIVNRLSTDWDFYLEFYNTYGGRLYEHFGDFNIPTIHEYIQIEVDSILRQDPRIQDIQSTVNKISKDAVECKLNIKPFGSDEILTMNLILGSDSSISINPNTFEGGI